MQTSGKTREFLRFLLVGGVNTATTWVLYLAFNLFTPYLAAYSAAYVIAVVVSYFLNAKWVFRTGVSLRSFAGFPMVYVVQFLFSSFLLYAFIEHLGVAEYLAPLLAVALTIPVTFLLSRFILVRFRSPQN